MSTTFSYNIPDISNVPNQQFTNNTIINNLLNDIKTIDISNMTYTTLERSNKLKNSENIKNMSQLSNFLQELDTLNKNLD